MSKTKFIMISLIISLFLVLFIQKSECAWGGTSATFSRKSMVNTSAPNFAMADLSGKVIRLVDLRGKGIILVFWSGNDSKSQRQLTQLQKAQEKYKDLVILGVTMDKDKDKIRQIVEDKKISCNIIADGEKLFRQYAVKKAPDSYYIDKYGVIKYHVGGSKMDNQGDVERRIKEILKDDDVKIKPKYR